MFRQQACQYTYVLTIRPCDAELTPRYFHRTSHPLSLGTIPRHFTSSTLLKSDKYNSRGEEEE
eukprot:6141514-Ditylum_brightwellii.AAC.1